MRLIYYDLVDEFDDSYETVYGNFSTRLRAEKFKHEFDGLDGYGVCEEDLKIVERIIELDEVSNWVLEFIEECKKRKMRDLKEES